MKWKPKKRARAVKVVIALEIKGDAGDAVYVVNKILDAGVLQESINQHDYDADTLSVKSAVVMHDATKTVLLADCKDYEQRWLKSQRELGEALRRIEELEHEPEAD